MPVNAPCNAMTLNPIMHGEFGNFRLAFEAIAVSFRRLITTIQEIYFRLTSFTYKGDMYNVKNIPGFFGTHMNPPCHQTELLHLAPQTDQSCPAQSFSASPSL